MGLNTIMMACRLLQCPVSVRSNTSQVWTDVVTAATSKAAFLQGEAILMVSRVTSSNASFNYILPPPPHAHTPNTPLHQANLLVFVKSSLPQNVSGCVRLERSSSHPSWWTFLNSLFLDLMQTAWCDHAVCKLVLYPGRCIGEYTTPVSFSLVMPSAYSEQILIWSKEQPRLCWNVIIFWVRPFE